MVNPWMNGRDRWLASFASDNTRDLYERVLMAFWEFAESRYESPRGVDAYSWLVDHRRAEVGKHSLDPLHCERIVNAWTIDLVSSDLEPSSRVTYAAVLSAIFGRMLPGHA